MPLSQSISTLDDIRKLLAQLPGPDAAAAAKAGEREPQLTKPPGSLGRLEDISLWLCQWQAAYPPQMDRPHAYVFAGNHGVTARGVSAFPSEVTVQMVANFEHGGAAINQICKTFGIELNVVALNLETPTEDFTVTPAMSESTCVEVFAQGMAVVTDTMDVLCLGEMGIGNTTSAAAICHALYGAGAEDWTGPGTGVQGDALTLKTQVVTDAVKHHLANISDGLDVLCMLGGRELAAIAGATLAARFKRVPVLLDGYVSSAAAAVLEATTPGALDHCLVGHASTEPGHLRLLDKIGKQPVLNMNMRLGEASGAALAVGILKAAAACHTGMATFAEAGVSDKD